MRGVAVLLSLALAARCADVAGPTPAYPSCYGNKTVIDSVVRDTAYLRVVPCGTPKGKP